MNIRPFLAVALAGSFCCSALAQHDSRPSKPGAPGQPATGAPGAKTPAPPSEEMQKMMQAMEAAGTPGEHHQHLTQLVGDWDCVVKFQMAPGQPWSESRGTASNTMIFDGRFLHEEFRSDFQGMPFRGFAVMGYNNLGKQYQSTWIDSMSTQIMTSTGTYDAAKKTFTMTGEGDDPMTGKKKREKEVLVVNSPDKHTSEFFEVGADGKEVKTMEITYTRRTGGGERGMQDKPAPGQPTRVGN